MNNSVTIITPNDRDVVLTRIFDAPRQLVFDALTRPELLARWYGPAGWTLLVCEIDLRVGGKWHFVSQRPDGKKFGQLGVYQEIVPGQRIVNTETWEDWGAGETLVTTVLVEHAGRTTLTSTVRFPSQAVRDTVLKGGMASGAEQEYEKLAAFLAETQAVARRS